MKVAHLLSKTGMNTKAQKIDHLPANTAPIQELLQGRIQREPGFVGDLLKEVVECFLQNDKQSSIISAILSFFVSKYRLLMLDGLIIIGTRS